MKHYFGLTLRAWKILKPFHSGFYFQLFLTFIISGLSVFITFLGSRVLNFIVEKDVRNVFIFLIFLLTIGILNVGVNYVLDYNSEKHLDQNIIQYLQELSLSKILSLTPEQHIEDHSAIKQQIINRGENAVEQIVKIYTSQFIPNLSYYIIATVTLFFHNYILGMLLLISSLILIIWINHFQKYSNPLIRQNRDNWTMQGRIKTEAFTHLQLVKLLNREVFFIKKYINNRKKYADFDTNLNLSIIKHKQRKNAFWEIVEQSGLGLAAILALGGYFSIGSIYLIWGLLGRAFWSVSSLSSSIRDLPIRYTEAEQYFDAIYLTPSFKESGKKNVSLAEDIIFKELVFKYPKNPNPVLNNVSLIIPSGKRTALVGSSGSGKSTIVKLLLRAYDYNTGFISIGNNELKEIDAGYLREHIGYVEQHVDLLDDTIKENIIFGVEEKSRKLAEKNLENIAQKARIDQFYHRLGDKKFDTMVGERGIKLSGGERQRVGIARAIIKNPEILIFDEATSSLDSENEKYVMEAINDVSKGKTTIIIAHRLSTVRNADKIIVMDKGKVVGEGTHEELLLSSPEYKNLVEHQLS